MTAMTDKELIRLAAKAAGIEHREHGISDDGCVWDVNRLLWWNPLTNDAHAVRLMVQLRIAVDPYVPELENLSSDEKFSVALLMDKRRFTQPHKSDANAATRRVIVRAAAEMN
ncbi:MAG: hypothetical protein ABIT70_01615 [Sulfuriferula sp.]